MNAVTPRMTMFPSRLDAWREARAFVEGFCADAAVDRERALKASLVLEELFLNSVKHGHAGGSDAPIWITLAVHDGRIALAFEDQAPPFNPFAQARRELLAALAPQRREGGLGLLLAHGLAVSSDYAYLYGRNRIRLTLA